MIKPEILHLEWERIDWDKFVKNHYISSSDYGIYQVYGNHPIYGNDVLLYIGKAQDQTFGTRLEQHWDFSVNFFSNLSRIHLGRLTEKDDWNKRTLEMNIDRIEKLLILANCPAFNANGIKGTLNTEEIDFFQVLNWGDYGSILPESSSVKYSNIFWDDNKNLKRVKKTNT